MGAAVASVAPPRRGRARTTIRRTPRVRRAGARRRPPAIGLLVVRVTRRLLTRLVVQPRCRAPAAPAGEATRRQRPGLEDASGVGRTPARRRRYSARGPRRRPARPGAGSATARRAAAVGVPSSSRSTSADQRDLRGVALAVEHRLPREQPADRHAVQPADEPAVAPGLDRVRPAQLVQPEVRRPDLGRRSSPTGRAGSAQASTTSSKAVSTRISNRARTARSDRETRSPSSGSTPRSYRAEPRHRAPAAARPASGTGRAGRPPAACPGSRSAPSATRSSSGSQRRRRRGTPSATAAARRGTSPRS